MKIIVFIQNHSILTYPQMIRLNFKIDISMNELPMKIQLKLPDLIGAC